MLNNFTERRNKLIELQKRLLIKFPEQDYNIYIFGSYIRDDFNPERSDIDIGLLCHNPTKRLDILNFLCETLDELIPIKRDIITVDLQPDCIVNIDILTTPFQLTDYKPEDIDIYLYKLLKKRREVQYFVQRARNVTKRQIRSKY